MDFTDIRMRKESKKEKEEVKEKKEKKGKEVKDNKKRSQVDHVKHKNSVETSDKAGQFSQTFEDKKTELNKFKSHKIESYFHISHTRQATDR